MNRESARGVGRTHHGSSDDPDVVDFSANTNPLVPEGMEAVYREAFETARRYPPDPPTAYREAAAAYVDCDPGQVIPTPGGLAAIRLAVSLAVEPGDSALLPSPSFGEYAREVRLQGGTPAFVPRERLLEADPADHALAVVCNPNNPTGELADPDALAAFAADCRASGTLCLVDEAFLGFTEQPSLAGTPGVVVARSLTKLFGLPGLRAGFAVATGEDREALAAARQTWNVGTPALATGRFLMTRDGFVEETRERVRRERRRLRESLADSYGVAPSDAPFLLLDVRDRDVDDVLGAAGEQGLALRDARSFRGLENHVRVAVRLPGEHDRLLEVLSSV